MIQHPATMGPAPWALAVSEVLAAQDVRVEEGLSTPEAYARLAQRGPNALIEKGGKSPFKIIWEQLTSTMVLVLLGAAVAASVLKGPRDAIAIVAIVILNVALGFFQEYKAERALAALKKLAAPQVRVRRDGRVVDLPAPGLVPGDVVLLEAGNAIPADGRLVEAVNLQIQEASLTGESQPVEKSTFPLPADAGLGDRRNMAYLGTAVTQGRGVLLLTATGMQTELGRIANLLETVSADPTPLQRRITRLGAGLAVAVLLVIGLSVVLGHIRGEPLREVLMTGVAVAVAAIPEGLPAVMTITLALGARRMLKRRALIRKLPAVETLGSVTVICSEKTGTLTENRMRVRVLDVAGHTDEITETLEGEHPSLTPGEERRTPSSPSQAMLVMGGALANDASLQRDSDGKLHTLGDPTEGALVVAAARYGFAKEDLEAQFPRVGEIPFTSERKRMSTLHERRGTMTVWTGSDRLLVTKGGVDVLLPLCDQVWDGGPVPWTKDLRQRVETAAESLAAKGLRVLGVAYRDVPSQAPVSAALESDLVFVGFLGLMDPPRPEAKRAVALCRQAGIRPVMITGDHPLTALQIARELGLVEPGRDGVLTGAELARLDQAGLEHQVEITSVYARVAPEQKLAIVAALQRRGHVVAMTGDGVNDAPALRRADIGVAMGITGTDVSKEAANMVILDDNFHTIVAAVEEGRTIYDNIRRFVKYIVSSNSAEVATLFIAPLAGLPMPLNTLQILWMNLVTDGLPGLALGLEQTEQDAMKRPPFSPKEGLFSRGVGLHVTIMGVVLAATALAVGIWAWHTQNPGWGSMVFTTLTLAQLGQAFAIRSNTQSVFKLGFAGNPLLLGALIGTLVLHMILLYWPPAQNLFGTVPLSGRDLLICLAASTSVFWAVEIEKFLLRRRNQML